QPDSCCVRVQSPRRRHYIAFSESKSLDLPLDVLQPELRAQEEDDVPGLQLRAQLVISQSSDVGASHNGQLTVAPQCVLCKENLWGARATTRWLAPGPKTRYLNHANCLETYLCNTQIVSRRHCELSRIVIPSLAFWKSRARSSSHTRCS